MKCIVEEKGAVKVVSAPVVTPVEGECRFGVKACGICGSDIPRVFMGTSYYYPIVLGHEFAGVVLDSTNKELVGKRACVFPILPCGKCESCQKEHWASCVKYDYYGSRRDGGLQSELLIKEKNLILLPDNVSFEAGAMIEPSAVCLHAVKKAAVDAKSTVAVFGAGTIGLLCAMWARAFGAKRVVLSDPNTERMAFAGDLGFAAMREDEAPDIVIEASGAAAALESGIARIKPLGKVVLVGNTERDVTLSRATYSTILRKQLTVCGSWNSDFRSDVNDWQESIDAISRGVIEPERLITHRFPLANADEAFALIGARRELYNKMMVVM